MAKKALLSLGEDWLGSGDVEVAWQQQDHLFGVCGSNGVVYALDRQGKKHAEISLPDNKRVLKLEWDSEGEALAFLQEEVPYVVVWNINNKHFTQLEVGQNDRPSFIKWSRTQPVLAIGTEKGGIVFFNKSTQRKIPTIGKHSSSVITGDWNAHDLLITGSQDKTVTVSTVNGDTKAQSSIMNPPAQLKWGNHEMATMILKEQLILAYNMNLKPIEISFQPHYGKILCYEWYEEDKLIAGCSEGWIVAVSTNFSEIGTELRSAKLFNINLDCLCVCKSLEKAAVAGENTVKIVPLNTFKEIKSEKIELPFDAGKVIHMHWTENGQILSVATSVGRVFNYLMVVPSLSRACGTTVALLSSINEISLVEVAGGVRISNKINLEIEPSIITLGKNHLAAAINTTVWYYRWKDSEGQGIPGGVCVEKRDYRGSVEQVQINSDWSACLCDGHVSLHKIETSNSGQETYFPQQSEAPVVSIAMTSHFLFMADKDNKVKCFCLEEGNYVAETRMDVPVSAIYPNASGTRVVIKDVTGGAQFYAPVNEKRLPIPNFSSSVTHVIWDISDHNLFVVCEPERVLAYLYSPSTLHGSTVEPVRELLSVEDLDTKIRESVTIIEKGQKPLVLFNGALFCHNQVQGNVKGNFLSSHTYINQWRGRSDSQEGHYRYFLQSLSLKRFQQCFNVSEKLGGVKIPEILGKLSLENLDLETAEKAYQLSKNVGMVYAIRSIKHEMEKQILLGYVAMILNQHDTAQDFFMKSSNPSLALEMRMDLQDWLIALQIARSVSPQQEPVISKKLAAQLETQGNYGDALKLFEKAASSMESAELSQEELNLNLMQSYAGMARNSIRAGDITRGYKIALELNDPVLKVECAQVCETMKHYLEAAQLYQRGGQPEKAASLYIKLKKWKEAADLMDVITTPKLLVQLAKAKEVEGNYKEAEDAYKKANDIESVIRLNLGPLDNPETAKELIKTKCPTQAAASMMAEYYENKGQKEKALEFLIMAEKKEDAFVIAQSFDCMDKYAQLILENDEKNSEEHLRIATFFEGRNKPGHAARHYEKAGNLQKAFQLFIQGGEEFYPEAINMASRNKSDMLYMQLYDYFMGEIDGIPKDPKFIYQLNLKMGKLKDASNTAIIIAGEEQESGNYKAAHDRLFETMKDMIESRLKVPHLMQNKLMIVHSYILVKRYVKMQDHLTAARLLIRVAKNISQFPAHTVQILTSTVIECIRAGLKEAAYNWACVLVRPEYRPLLDEKFKKQIEKVAIKRPRVPDPEEESSPCPFCSAYILDMELDCESCKNTIPYCLASGKHMLLSNWTSCPNCKFPANLSDFEKSLQADRTCPMCESTVNPSALKLNPDPVSELRSLQAPEEES